MLVIKDTREVEGKFSRTVMTIGNFDGVHRGHQALIGRLIERAREIEGKSVVFTFHPHPLKVMAPEKCPPLINLPPQKISLFEKLGVDIVVNQEFTREFALQSPRDFVELILCKPLHPVEIFVGSDFRFGKAREGNIDCLQKLGAEFGFEVRIVDPITYKEVIVSSTLIRKLLAEGRIEEASEFLGRSYAITGTVVKGDARGRELGFPTANVRTENDIILRKGVYAVKVHCLRQTFDGVTNIGLRPTFNKDTLTIEVFIFDFDDDCYEQPITLEFVARLRDEKAFKGPDDLVAQIQKDVVEAQRILSS